MKNMKILYAAVIFLLLAAICPAQEKINTSFEYSRHQIIIHYEFAGDTTLQYDLSVILKRTSVPQFNLKPGMLSGDIGKGNFANSKRSIVWHLTQDEEESLTGDDYYFEITANEIKKGGGIAWYVYVGGLLLGGGAAAVLMNNKKNTPSSTGTTSLASPPARPGN